MGAKKERGFHLRVQVPRGPRLGLIMTIKNQQQQIIINIVRVKTKTNKSEPTNNKEQQQFKKRRLISAIVA